MSLICLFTSLYKDTSEEVIQFSLPLYVFWSRHKTKILHLTEQYFTKLLLLYWKSMQHKNCSAKWMQHRLFLAYSSIRKLQRREERLYIPNHLSYPLYHYYCLHFLLHFRVYSKWNININFFLLHESSDNLG